MDRTVRVTGSGSVQVAPDLAVVRVTAVQTAPAAVDALAGAASASALAAERAREHVEARHVGTTGVDLWPAHDHEGRPRGFEARHALILTCTELDRVGPLLDSLAGALGERLRVDGVSLQVADSTGLRERAVRASSYAARTAPSAWPASPVPHWARSSPSSRRRATAAACSWPPRRPARPTSRSSRGRRRSGPR